MEPYILIHVVLQLQKECSPFGAQDEARINLGPKVREVSCLRSLFSVKIWNFSYRCMILFKKEIMNLT